jgi:hypothetical protein
MSGQEPETVDDEIADQAGEMLLEMQQEHEEKMAEQEAFLETVAEEEGSEVLETQCNIIGDYTVPIKAKLNGELMDRLSHMDARVERFEQGEARGYEITEAADEISQILADVVDDTSWGKQKFYAAYEQEGLAPLGVMLERAFESLKEERERQQGAAEGFRAS